MLLQEPILIGTLSVENRLVMPPMQTNKTERGHVTEEQVDYYRDRAVRSRPGIIITEHSCISESGRAAEGQLSLAADELIEEHLRLTDAIREGGCKSFVQLNHAGSNGIGDAVSASAVSIPVKKLTKRPARSHKRRSGRSRSSSPRRRSGRSKPDMTGWRSTAPMPIC